MGATQNYTHGFEEIYALEDIDVSSIRPLTESKEEKPAPPKRIVSSPEPYRFLELGDNYRRTIPSFILLDPIQQLGLPRHLEAYLLSHGLLTIGDARKSEKPEVEEKIAAFGSLDECQILHWASLLRGLLGGANPVRNYVFLSCYDLECYVNLTPQEKLEERRLTSTKREEYIAECRQQLVQKNDILMAQFRLVVDAFIKPWIASRGGLATAQEVFERIEGISEDPTRVEKVLALFQENKLPLCFADRNLYASDLATAELYDTIIDSARSYFYRDGVSYCLDELEQLIGRERAKLWEGYPDGFLRLALRLSPQFCVRKGFDSKLHIKKL